MARIKNTLTHPITGEDVGYWFELLARNLVDDHCQVTWVAEATLSDGTAMPMGRQAAQWKMEVFHWDVHLLARELVKDALR